MEFGDSLVDGASHVVHVEGRKAAHADSATLQEVDMLLFDQELAHFWVQSGERKHTDLEEDKNAS